MTPSVLHHGVRLCTFERCIRAFWIIHLVVCRTTPGHNAGCDVALQSQFEFACLLQVVKKPRTHTRLLLGGQWAAIIGLGAG